MRFERLVVGDRVAGARDTTYICLCDCGNQAKATAHGLRSGRNQSCGCLGKERRLASVTKHGLTPSDHKKWHPLYRTWQAMKQRCYNPLFPKYASHGGRGIKVCEQWRHDFETFLRDIGTRPSPKHSLDRFPDNDGDYEPGNVRWATPKEQARNCRTTTWITYQGETLSHLDWADRLGITPAAIKIRIRKGWSAERALFAPRHK